jgi:hypothetical protein
VDVPDYVEQLRRDGERLATVASFTDPGAVEPLASAPADLETWTFLEAPTPLAFWARRQAHETAIHRVDAESARGDVTGFPSGFAVDGIDELLLRFANRPGRPLPAVEKTRSMVVRAKDEPRRWRVTFAPSHSARKTIGRRNSSVKMQLRSDLGEPSATIDGEIPECSRMMEGGGPLDGEPLRKVLGGSRGLRTARSFVPIDGCWIEWHASKFHDPVRIERPAVVE